MGGMTREEALGLIEQYAGWADDSIDDVLYDIDKRFPADGSENKAMRWLGFCQGVLVERGIFTLDDVKHHSKNKTVMSGVEKGLVGWSKRNPGTKFLCSELGE